MEENVLRYRSTLLKSVSMSEALRRRLIGCLQSERLSTPDILEHSAIAWRLFLEEKKDFLKKKELYNEVEKVIKTNIKVVLIEHTIFIRTRDLDLNEIREKITSTMSYLVSQDAENGFGSTREDAVDMHGIYKILVEYLPQKIKMIDKLFKLLNAGHEYEYEWYKSFSAYGILPADPIRLSKKLDVRIRNSDFFSYRTQCSFAQQSGLASYTELRNIMNMHYERIKAVGRGLDPDKKVDIVAKEEELRVLEELNGIPTILL